MITLNATRSDTETVKKHFFPIINMYKDTRLNNVAHTKVLSEAYLGALTINCLVTEIELYLEKKLFSTTGQKVKLQFTDAQGIILYLSLLALPLPGDQVYFNLIRQQWIEIIDQQLHQAKILLLM